MGTVYLIQSTKRRTEDGELTPKFDVSSALEFGPIVELLPGGRVVTSTAPMVATLRYKLRSYCDDDYLLALGGPAEIGAAVAIAASRNEGRVRILIWDKHAHRYIPVSINIHGTTRNDDE